MSDAFTTWLNALLLPIVDIYGQMLGGFPLNFLSYILSAVLLALFLQVIFAIFPPLKSIVGTIMTPFRIVHVWLHIRAARQIINKRRVTGDSASNSLQFISLFSTGFGTKSENSALALSGTCSPREAASIANAPLKGVLVLIIFLMLLTPFLRTSFAGKLVHLYIFAGIATTSFPSTSDYKYTHNMLLLNSQLAFSWLLLPVAVFSAFFITVMVWTGNLVYAIIWGAATTMLAGWLILMVTMRKQVFNGNSEKEKLEISYSAGEEFLETYHDGINSSTANNFFCQLENDQ